MDWETALWAWYGADFDAVNALLSRPAATPGPDLQKQAHAYRQVLSLLIAQRRPSYFLVTGRDNLSDLTQSYLRVLADVGIVSPALGMRRSKAEPSFRDEGSSPIGIYVKSWKGANAVRTRLLSLLEAPRLYDIDRLDLTVTSTLDTELMNTVTGMLHSFGNPEFAKSAHLREPRLLAAGDPSALTYSFALYERTPGKNLVRVQTDSSNQPFDINEGAKLELGSTAKLRTLATYLSLIESLHERYSGLDAKALRAVEVGRKDRLTRWAIDYLSSAPDRDLSVMLDAAMERRYSANPAEEFFTAGGVHTFSNFKREENGRTPTVREAIRDSVNLPFIRVMRDIVDHYNHRAPESPARVLDDAHHPGRAAVPEAIRGPRGKGIRPALLPQVSRHDRGRGARHPAPGHASLAAAARCHIPYGGTQAGVAGDDGFPARASARLATRRQGARRRCTSATDRNAIRWGTAATSRACTRWSCGSWPTSVPTRTRASRRRWKQARRNGRTSTDGSTRRTRETPRTSASGCCSRMEAFQEIHRHWKRLAYPFEALVPSYATAIGVSGDRPAALAELIGIILNDGVRQPTVRLEELHFAAGNALRDAGAAAAEASEQVMKPEVAAALRKALTSVVEDGTARRLKGAFNRPDKKAPDRGRGRRQDRDRRQSL
jgi:membrane peptidoglycan carboxypeptidase